jgi:hypothetical protein
MLSFVGTDYGILTLKSTILSKLNCYCLPKHCSIIFIWVKFRGEPEKPVREVALLKTFVAGTTSF